MLDIRLQTCFDMVSGRGIACDVGTDHALLAAELINSGKCTKVIASDIKEGPLAAAAKTVERCGAADKIKLILSDGLANVPLDGVTDIVIAGMGGETIADIIADREELKCPEKAELSLILQPMTKAEVLRRQLYEMGFEVIREQGAIDGDKIYTVMLAQYVGKNRRLTEFESIYGFFSEDDTAGKKYREAERERLKKVAEALRSSGRNDGAVHAESLAAKMSGGGDVYALSAIYDCLDEEYPFKLQEKWDNSGLLADSGMDVTKVLVTLDIDTRALDEAELKGADLIVSHHPVIFDPLRRIDTKMPIYRLIHNDISAICMHTNADIAAGGTNGVILRELTGRYGLECEPEILEETGGNVGFGYICTFAEPVGIKELAETLKKVFGCEYVRATSKEGSAKRVAFCSGSGGSMLDIAAAKNCDVFITGDVKHDVWIESRTCGVNILDCGHFHTENPVIWAFRRTLEEKFPQLDVELAESSTDPCVYF